MDAKKHLKRKERILQASEQIFRKEGFQKSSLDDLVSQLHISKSTIYDYFGSKTGLIDALADRLSDQLEARLETISNDHEIPVETRLFEIAMFQGDIARELNSKFVEELKIYQPDMWKKYLIRRAYRIKNHYAGLIQEGIDNGLFNKKYSKDFLVQLYLKMSDLVSTTDMLDHIDISPREAYELIFSVYLKGVK